MPSLIRAAAPREGHSVAHPRKTSSEPPSASQSRTLLGALLARVGSALTGLARRGGRLSLYAGLLLVALTALRLPGGTGGIADVFLFVSMVCALLTLAQGRRLKIPLLKTHAIGLTLLVSGVLIGTLAESSDDLQSLLRLGKFLFATSATIVACMVLIERRNQLTIALGCWVVSAAITSLVAVLQASLGDPLISDEPLWGRMTGLSVNPNHLGAIAAMAMAGGMSLAAVSGRLRSILWLVATLLCTAGVVVSASRSGAVVAVISLAIWGLMFYRLKREFTFLAVGCCLAGAAAASFVYVQVWSGADVSDRLADATDPYADAALAGRLHQYEAALSDAVQDPLAGVGLAFRDVGVHGEEVHNTFLMLLRAGGLLSLAGIVIILADLLRKGLVAYGQAGTSRSKGLVIGLFAGVVGLTLDALIEPVLFQRQYWIPSALLMALIACRDRPGRSPMIVGERKRARIPLPGSKSNRHRSRRSLRENR